VPPPRSAANAACAAALLAAATAGAETRGPAPAPASVFLPFTFVQGGLSTSFLLHADSLCPEGEVVCPIGGGGGIMVSYGRRYHPQREWLVGYDLTVRNARNIFASATLQQLRGEHRWVLWSPRTNLEGFAGLHGGIAIYGERFGAITAGIALGTSVGMNYHLGAFFSLGLIARVEALRFLPFDTGDGVRRADGGVATVSGTLHLTLTYRGR
jgi:hypothetical protein